MYECIRYVGIKMTDYCNLDCEYCFENRDSKESRNVFTEEKAKYLTKFLLSQKLPKRLEVRFTGGEVSLVLPLLKRVIRQLRKIERYRDIKLIFSLITNGTNPEGVIDLMDKGYLEPESMKVSWDGVHSSTLTRHTKDSKFNDDFFNRGIQILGRSKYGKKVLIAYSVNKNTIDHMADDFRYSVEHGCTKLCYYYYYTPTYPGYYTDPEFQKKMEKQLYKLAEYYIQHPFDYENWNELYYTTYITEDKKIFHYNPCNYFGNMIYVDLKGRIFPCMLTSYDTDYFDHPLCIGDIYNGFSKGRLERFRSLFLQPSSFCEDISCENDQCQICPVMMNYTKRNLSSHIHDKCAMRSIETKVFREMCIPTEAQSKKYGKKMDRIVHSKPNLITIPDSIFNYG